jgi:hypothetical protein
MYFSGKMKSVFIHNRSLASIVRIGWKETDKRDGRAGQ